MKKKKVQNQTEVNTHTLLSHALSNENSQTLPGNFKDSFLNEKEFRFFYETHHISLSRSLSIPSFPLSSLKKTKALWGSRYSLFFTEYKNKSLFGKGSFLLVVSSEGEGGCW
jgi:hypothetical protein